MVRLKAQKRDASKTHQKPHEHASKCISTADLKNRARPSVALRQAARTMCIRSSASSEAGRRGGDCAAAGQAAARRVRAPPALGLPCQGTQAAPGARERQEPCERSTRSTCTLAPCLMRLVHKEVSDLTAGGQPASLWISQAHVDNDEPVTHMHHAYPQGTLATFAYGLTRCACPKVLFFLTQSDEPGQIELPPSRRET